MSSGLSSRPIPIVFPNRQLIDEKSVSKISSNPLFEVTPAASRFDPDCASSPPDNFVETLKQRMEHYYSRDMEMFRSRANSLSIDCN
jgi:hypothetical protein